MSVPRTAGFSGSRGRGAPGPLAGRIALVTGAAAGIGRATALRLAAAGARLALVDRDARGGLAVARALRARGAEALFIRADVTRERDVAAMVARTVATLGGLDVLVNNAGGGRFFALETLTPRRWDALMALNLRSAYLACRHALPHLARRPGVILNVASQSGLQGQARNAAYCAAKAGLVLFTRALARELGPRGIRVNCLCPGGTETALLRRYVGGRLTAARRRALTREIPLRRLARPEEVAAVALFLVSDEASYITGAVIPVDGGATA